MPQNKQPKLLTKQLQKPKQNKLIVFIKYDDEKNAYEREFLD